MRSGGELGDKRAKQTKHERHSSIIAVLVEKQKRVAWRALLQFDGVRVFWFDEQDDLFDFLDENHVVTAVIVDMPSMDDKGQFDYCPYPAYFVSDNPDDIDMMDKGQTWIPELTTKTVSSILNL